MAEGKKEISPRLHEIREFCASTTAHGLGRAAEAKSRLARIFWMLIFTAAFILSVYQISSSFHDYLQFPTQTEVYLVNKERLFFPAVTVCNLNPFKLSTLINTALWHNIVSIVVFFCVTFCFLFRREIVLSTSHIKSWSPAINIRLWTSPNLNVVSRYTQFGIFLFILFYSFFLWNTFALIVNENNLLSWRARI